MSDTPRTDAIPRVWPEGYDALLSLARELERSLNEETQRLEAGRDHWAHKYATIAAYAGECAALLRTLQTWDHLEGAADGPFFKRLITSLLAKNPMGESRAATTAGDDVRDTSGLASGTPPQRPSPANSGVLNPVNEPTEDMVIAGFECEAFDALDDTYRMAGDGPGRGPSCKQAAEAVRGIYKAMVAARCGNAIGSDCPKCVAGHYIAGNPCPERCGWTGEEAGR